jgi:ligand-binding SRPBCC domain-containing protein
VMEAGALIDCGLSLYGVPMRWRTRIEEFTPNERFIDVQLNGPYRLWHHTHIFEEHAEGTLMRDEVNYQVPFGPLGTLARALFVRRQLEQIFDYRVDVIESYFP